MSSPQVAFPQAPQLEEKNRIRLMQVQFRQKRNQVQGAIQFERLIQRQQVILGDANVRQARISVGYTLEKEQFSAVNRRVKVHLRAQQYWINQHCQLTSEQNEHFDDMVRISLDKNFKLWNNNFLLPTVRELLPITLVINGMGQSKFNDSLWHKKINLFLTNPQQESLGDARHERETWLRSAVRDHAYAELDKFLYFTPKQRPLVERHLDEMISKSSSKCFSMSNQKSFFPYGDTIELLAGFPHEEMTPSQTAMLKLKRSHHRHRTRWCLILSSSDSPEVIHEKIEQLAEKLRQELMPLVMIRFDCLSAFLNLRPEAARRLEVAAKGAVHYKVDESKYSALQSFRNAEARMNKAQPGAALKISVTFPVPGIDAVLSHPIIQEIEISLEEEFEAYFKIIAQNEHKARVAYTVSLLDRELWLTQTQREAFTELITSRLAVKPISAPDHIYEIVLVAYPLATISDQEIGEILDQSQIAAWKELKTHFQFSDDPSVDDSASLKLPRANEKIVFKVSASVASRNK